jgi:valyl-tRNA synthetase
VNVLAGVDPWELTTSFERRADTVQRIYSDIEIFVFVEGVIDLAKERKRMESELAASQSRLEGLRKRLTAGDFVDKAPAEVIEGERARERELETLVKDLEQSLAGLR